MARIKRRPMPHQMTRSYKFRELKVGMVVEATSNFFTSGAVQNEIRGWIIGRNPLLNAEIVQGNMGIVEGFSRESPDFVVVAFEHGDDETVTIFAHHTQVNPVK